MELLPFNISTGNLDCADIQLFLFGDRADMKKMKKGHLRVKENVKGAIDIRATKIPHRFPLIPLIKNSPTH